MITIIWSFVGYINNVTGLTLTKAPQCYLLHLKTECFLSGLTEMTCSTFMCRQKKSETLKFSCIANLITEQVTIITVLLVF